MNTDDMLIAYTKNTKSFVDNFEQILNESFEATPREKVEYMGMHIVQDRERGYLGNFLENSSPTLPPNQPMV